MKRFYSKVISHPVMITVIFVILTIFFGLCKPLIPLNYDMNDYLPDDSHSTVSLLWSRSSTEVSPMPGL